MFLNKEAEKGNYSPAVITLLLIIAGSLVFFGNYWFKKLNPSDSKEESTENLLGKETAAPTPAPTNEAEKSDVPTVEAFVMSHCPYGTQIEKGMIPVVKTLGDTIDFELKFVDYAMHDKKELDEQLAQYCIQENEPEKLISYLECFLEDGESQPCLESTGINQATLNTCVASTDAEYNVTASYNDKSTWEGGQFPPFDVHAEENEKYGVRGSPTLVVNGSQAQLTSRDPNSILQKICTYFTEKPEACSQELSTEVPGPGFGYNSTGSSNTATCN